jgi:hypothetical protein
MICCGNWYLCQLDTKTRCDDNEECHAIARAIVGTETDRYRKCHVVKDEGFFRYEFEMIPTFDFTRAIRKVWKRERRTRQ